MFDKLPNSHYAITLSHFSAYKTISDFHDYGLILEDDAILDKDFKTKLYKYISQLPNDYDMLFIGDGCGLHIPVEKKLLTETKE